MSMIEPWLGSGESEASLFEGVTGRLRNGGRVSAIRRNSEAIRGDFPEFLSRIVEKARIQGGSRHVLPGTQGEPCFVGAPPDWHANPVNDNEYLWSLNRMSWWPNLLWAWTLTGERAFAKQVVDEFYSWVTECPRPPLSPDEFMGVTPWRSLEVGQRMFTTWPRMLEHLLDSEFWTPELVSTYARSAAEHAEVLSEICPQYWPEADHNHYLTEMIGLFAVSCHFPELASAERWRLQAVTELERCIRNQLTSDGGQIEGCPGYHNHCITRLCQTVKFAGEHGISFPDDAVERVRKGVEYSVHASRPFGTIVPWGDSDANTSHLQSALYGAFTLGESGPLTAALKGVSPAVVDDAVMSMLSSLDDLSAACETIERLRGEQASLPHVHWQHDLKQAAVRTGWHPRALSVFFGCHTPVHHGGHAHMDPMGFDFSACGDVLLVDPGRFTYREGEDRVEFKSATSHNTVTVDGREPYEYLRKFDYGPQQWGAIYDMDSTENIIALRARQENFLPVVHYRDLYLVHERFLVVVDGFRDIRPDQTAELHFHLNSEISNVSLRESDTVTASFDAANGRPGLSLSVHPTVNCRVSSARARPGRVSERIDVARDSCITQVTVTPEDNAQQTLEVVSVAVPQSGHAELSKFEQGWAVKVTTDEGNYTFRRVSGRVECENTRV